MPVRMLRSMMAMVRGDIQFRVVFSVDWVCMMERYACMTWLLSQESVLFSFGICSVWRSELVLFTWRLSTVSSAGLVGDRGGCSLSSSSCVERRSCTLVASSATC